MIFKGRYAHGMGAISENTAYRSVLVSISVSVDKFSFVVGIESIGKKWYRYTFNIPYIANRSRWKSFADAWVNLNSLENFCGVPTPLNYKRISVLTCVGLNDTKFQ